MTKKIIRLVLGLGIVITFLTSIFYFIKGDQPTTAKTSQSTTAKSSTVQTTQSKSATTSTLPDVSSSDWELILVNRDHITAELNPELATVGNIQVDARIADAVEQFLVAAQALDSAEHLISGYRSVAYQEQVYEGYVQQEMATGLSREEAEKKVQTYSQPAGASEHQTGLAIDMSTVDSLNQSDPALVEKVKALAPQYGFVLRFSDTTQDETGIGYEDWHYRYVGKESAAYMTEHNLSLEAYLDLLKENGK